MSKNHKLPDIGPFVTPHDGNAIVYWEDARSLTWLARTMSNKAFLKLVRFYEAQCDKFMCGPASVAIVLNALKMGSNSELPLDLEYESFSKKLAANLPSEYVASFRRYTQRNIFSVENHQTKTLHQLYGAPDRDGVTAYGLSLKDMHELLLANGVKSRLHYVENHKYQGHVANLIHALSSENQYVIANFDRAVWGLKGGGHVSPLGAYDHISDKILILDVNMCGRWLWIDVDLLLQSMATRDSEQSRGYLIVS